MCWVAKTAVSSVDGWIPTGIQIVNTFIDQITCIPHVSLQGQAAGLKERECVWGGGRGESRPVLCVEVQLRLNPTCTINYNP